MEHFFIYSVALFLPDRASGEDLSVFILLCGEDTVWDDQHLLSWLMRWIQQGQRVDWTSLLDRPAAAFFAACSQGRPHRLPNWIKYTWCLPLHSSAPPRMRGARRSALALMLLFSSAPWTAPGGFAATSCLLLDGEAHCSTHDRYLCNCWHKSPVLRKKFMC